MSLSPSRPSACSPPSLVEGELREVHEVEGCGGTYATSVQSQPFHQPEQSDSPRPPRPPCPGRSKFKVYPRFFLFDGSPHKVLPKARDAAPPEIYSGLACSMHWLGFSANIFFALLCVDIASRGAYYQPSRSCRPTLSPFQLRKRLCRI